MFEINKDVKWTAKIKEYQPCKPAEVAFWEGPDYSGKTTNINKVAEHIRGYGLKVLVLKEPGGTPITKHIRNILLNPDIIKDEGMDYLTRRLLYTADHMQTMKHIKDNMGNYDYIFCDRYNPLSDMVYGFMMDDSNSRRFKEVISAKIDDITHYYLINQGNYEESKKILLDSKLILMKLSDSEIEKRAKKRLEQDGQAPDVFDLEGIEYKKRINWNYEHITRIIEDGQYQSCDREFLLKIVPFYQVGTVNADNDENAVLKDTFKFFSQSVLERVKYKIK